MIAQDAEFAVSLAFLGAIAFYAFAVSSLLPHLIPRAEIDALAEAVMREHPDDPEGWAYCEEEAAWYRSDGPERGKWLRVRRAIRRRLQARRCQGLS